MMNRSLSIFLLAMLPALLSFGYFYWELFLRDFLAEDVTPFANHWIDWIAILLMHIFHHPEREVTAWITLTHIETLEELDHFEVKFITTQNSLRAIEDHAEDEFERKMSYYDQFPDHEMRVISLELPYLLPWEVPNEQGLDYRYPVYSPANRDIEFE